MLFFKRILQILRAYVLTIIEYYYQYIILWIILILKTGLPVKLYFLQIQISINLNCEYLNFLNNSVINKNYLVKLSDYPVLTCLMFSIFNLK